MIRLTLCTGMIGLMSFAVLAGETVRVVAREGDMTEEWTAAYLDVQAAIAAAGEGGTVLFRNGHYDIATTLELTAANQTLSGESRDGVVLDGGGKVRVFTSNGKATPTIEHLTVAGGYLERTDTSNDYGAGVYMSSGAGAYLVNDCVFTNNVLNGQGLRGGGFASYNNANGLVTNCLFVGNSQTNAGNGNGGGAAYYDWQSGTVNFSTLADCVITNNSVVGNGPRGGAIFANGKIRVVACRFFDNALTTTGSAAFGGGIHTGSNAEILGCTFGQTASGAYGTCCSVSSSSVISNCVFRDIQMVNCVVHLYSDSLVTDCVFTNNVGNGSLVGTQGGQANLCVRNSLFADNCLDDSSGYAFWLHACKSITTENCTFAGNGTKFSAHSQYSYSTNTYVNCVFQGFGPKDNGVYRVVMMNSLTPVDPGGSGSSGVIVTKVAVRMSGRHDYRLPAGSPGVDGGVWLDWMEGAKDLAKDPRVVGVAPDMGCFERQAGEVDPLWCTRAVADEKDREGVWKDAFVGIQPALDAAFEGELLLVKAGTYKLTETLNVLKQIEVRSDDGSGNLATETTIIDGGATPEDATTGVQPVVLAKAGAALIGFTIRNGYATDFGGGVKMTADATLVADCFITNCVATNVTYGAKGGGIALIGDQTDVLRTTIVDCKANNGGGVSVGGAAASMSAYGSSADYPRRVVGCQIIDNEATHKDVNATGGGLHADGGCWIGDCFFRGNWLTCTSGDKTNSSNRRGAAMEIQKYTTVTNCIFETHGSGNRSIVDGGNPCKVTGCVFRGLTSTSGNIVGDGNLSESVVENCVFTNNSAKVVYDSAHFKNCLFAYNTVQLTTMSSVFENCTVVSNMRGFHLESKGSKPVFINCVSAGNGNLSVSNSRGWNNFCFIWQAHTNNVTMKNCCFDGVTSWTNDMLDMPPEVWSLATLDPTGKSFAEDPKFVDAENGDYRLAHRSPCVDMGVLCDWMTTEAVDLDGNPRVVKKGMALDKEPSALPDIGCYECQLKNPGLMLILR